MSLRTVSIQRSVNEYAEGSALISAGKTRVLVTASVLNEVPPWMRGQRTGWLTAEYGMLPRSTHDRKPRDKSRDGRTIEIQRLIGRALRAAIDLSAIGERTIAIDADVLLADGGTRTAAVTAGMVALGDAVLWMMKTGLLARSPLRFFVAAVSVGVVDGKVITDLEYKQDSNAETDMNVVMAETGEFIEVQGTGERGTFGRERLTELLDAATIDIRKLFDVQKAAFGPEAVRELGRRGPIA
jgi:ribonuclease PH